LEDDLIGRFEGHARINRQYEKYHARGVSAFVRASRFMVKLANLATFGFMKGHCKKESSPKYG
jgi:hypothetical protein